MTNDWNTFALLSAPTDLPGLNSVLCQGAAVCTSQLPQPWIKHVQEGRRNRSSFCMADILVRLKKAFLSLTLRQFLPTGQLPLQPSVKLLEVHRTKVESIPTTLCLAYHYLLIGYTWENNGNPARDIKLQICGVEA